MDVLPLGVSVCKRTIEGWQKGRVMDKPPVWIDGLPEFLQPYTDDEDYEDLVAEQERRLAAFTLSVESNMPKRGFMIAGEISQEEHKIPAGKIVKNGLLNEIRKFSSNHATLLAKSERYIGGWFEKRKVYLDVLRRLNVSRLEALRIGRNQNQSAVWDLKRGELVYTMDDQKNPKDSKVTTSELEAELTFVPFALRVDQHFEANLEKLGEAYAKLLETEQKGKA